MLVASVISTSVFSAGCTSDESVDSVFSSVVVVVVVVWEDVVGSVDVEDEVEVEVDVDSPSSPYP